MECVPTWVSYNRGAVAMESDRSRAIAIVGVGAILPDASTAPAYWQNIRTKRYSITEVPRDRWCVEDYFDPDPTVPDKSYSKIGGWVRGFGFDWKQFRIPPRVAAMMDEGQQWAVSVAAECLNDYGYPSRPLNVERTGVILGTAMGGELHYITALRIHFPEYARVLEDLPRFKQLPPDTQTDLMTEWRKELGRRIPEITEDSMPGELANIVAGRVANTFNLRGPNFITDAACASSFAAISAAIELLVQGQVDAVLTGGVDRNMGAPSFVKFCKVGALSATGTRPFGDGADGFVMGEGAGVFLLKRLADAERDGDKIYAVIRGVGASSDGKGKGITAPNPQGQVLSIRRAWENARLDPQTCTLIEAHGTSTKVGDVVEVSSLTEVFCSARPGSIGLGSAKSNIGHLKSGAGAAGLLKATYALHHRELPPTLNARTPNSNINFAATPFRLIHETEPWQTDGGTPRRCGVSAYGFGGTNFHLVLEEHVPGGGQNARMYAGVAMMDTESNRQRNGVTAFDRESEQCEADKRTHRQRAAVRGILAFGASSPAELRAQLEQAQQRLANGWSPEWELPAPELRHAPYRLLIDFGTPAELTERLGAARQAAAKDDPVVWRALQSRGVFWGAGTAPGKLAFLFPGQGSQYVNMGRELKERLPVVAETFAEADAVLTPILGRPLTSYIFCDTNDDEARTLAENALTQTAITQPAVLTLDLALYRALEAYGVVPDAVMGHSLGEYGALVAAGVMPFADALEAAAARGAEMTKVSVEDKGWMAAIMAPLSIIEETLREVDGYVVPANINSHGQCVIGGASKAVEQAIAAFERKGFTPQRLPVSHAFHTAIVAPAAPALRKVLDRLQISPPRIPVIGNVTGETYPSEPEAIKDYLERQIASPVQWAHGLETLYASGCRAFAEVGPKRALKGFADEVLASRGDIVSTLTCHPKTGELASFNQALCALWAAGYGSIGITQSRGVSPEYVLAENPAPGPRLVSAVQGPASRAVLKALHPARSNAGPKNGHGNGGNGHKRGEMGVDKLVSTLVQVLEQTKAPAWNGANGTEHVETIHPYDRNTKPLGSVVVSGTGLGLPGAHKQVMDPENALRILRGEPMIDLLPLDFRKKILDKRITCLVKGENGGGTFQVITQPDEVIRLAGRRGGFDLAEEYGVPEKLVESLDITSQLAMAAGLDALREAGIPMLQMWRHTTTGKDLPDRWVLPESMRDETGVIFASVFPGGSCLADEFERYYAWENKCNELALLEDLRHYTRDPNTLVEIDRRIGRVRSEMERAPYEFDRRFLFRILAMGHSQFAEYIGARGPNTQINSACATTTQAVGMAEDWIRTGRCRRVLVISGDDVTGDALMEWVGAGFLALGAAATDDRLEEAALPFDRRRHGTLLGMGACALVIESEDAVRERGMRGIVEILSTESSNSAYHGSRLDVDHISLVMEGLVSAAERRFGLNRYAIAPYTVFVSHETFTPARGGSASAEVAALRKTFGETARDIIVANTKGFTGHPMGVGVEDVTAIKILEHSIVPPVPNYREVDPELGPLNLSRGGVYPVSYALHLAAGFGSQISMTFLRRIPGRLDRIDDHLHYQHWLDGVSGYDNAELEVEKRVLRIRSKAGPGRRPTPCLWHKGTGPAVRAMAPGDGPPSAYRPAPMYQIAELLEDANVEGLPPTNRAWSAPARRAPELAPATEEHLTAAAEVVQTAPVPVSQVLPQARVPLAAPAALAPVQSASGAEAPADDEVGARVLALVADKTGYPPDMLDMDLDLEADLGIDTVKQAETFAAIRQMYDIPPQQGLSLRDYPTLAHVVQFVYRMRPDLAGTEEVSPDEVKAADVVQASVAGTPAEIVGADPVRERVLALVADKTGYPPDMLDMDLDLEADLGIDTVKQAETFAAIREAYTIPPQQGLSLRDYPTLAHVVQFVYRFRPDLAPMVVPEEARPFEITAASPEDAASSDVGTELEPAELPAETGFFPPRVPTPSLRPSVRYCKPTGVSLDAAIRVVVMLDEGGVGAALGDRLTSAGVEALLLRPAIASEGLEGQLRDWMADGPIHGVYWLPALDVEPALEETDLAVWRELNGRRTKNLYVTMRTLYDCIAGPGRFLVAGTRMGGLHGYGESGAGAPLGGGVTGFTKAYAIEQGLRPEGAGLLVKAVDFEAALAPAEAADLLIAETTADPAVIEVGYYQGHRYTINLAERAAREAREDLTLGRNTVFVVTGAAGGITSAIVEDLARHSAGVFFLLDLAPMPSAHDEYVALFRRGRDALKQALVAEARARGEKPTPVQIDRVIAQVERGEAALRTVQTVEAAGGKAYYRSLDLRDGAAVSAVVDEVRALYGRIDVLVHAGGVLIDRTLPEKQPEQFDLVFDVKADGYFNLLKASQGMPLGAVVAFSSVAGRFGNNGQADYSAANDLLCKVTTGLRQSRPETRGIAIDWTAWGQIGMAARGSVPQIMAALGVDMLPPQIGVPVVRRELRAGGANGEVVVAGRLGAWLQERDPNGGVASERINAVLAEERQRWPMLGRVPATPSQGGLEIETLLDPKTCPFLYDHAPDPDTPWLPGVMAIETLAEAAALLADGYQVAAVDNVVMSGALKFFRMEPRTLLTSAIIRPTASGTLTAQAVIRSESNPSRPGLPSQVREHFAGDIRLVKRLELPAAISFEPPAPQALPVESDEIYRSFFHGPAYRVIERAGVSAELAVAWFAADLPLDTLPGARLLMAPRLIELCFQAAALWSQKICNAMAFPLGLGSVEVYRQAESGQLLYALVRPRGAEVFDAQVVDDAGNLYLKLSGYRTVTRPL
jgi:malonyl CoA-acyl carrier protein transacylase